MGRGLSAILSVSEEGAARRGGAPAAAGRADLAEPAPAAAALRRGGAAGARGLAGRARRAAAGARAAAARRHVRAGRRRAPLARGADRRARRRSRRSCASATTPLALELALIENMAREDLSPIEEARACAALVEELGLTREDVGRRVGRSRVAVSNLIRLLDLPDEVIELLQEGALSEGHGRALLLAEDHGERRALGRAAPPRRVVGARHRGARPREQRAARRSGSRSAPPAGRGALHPDQEQQAEEIADALSAALGAEVRVRPRRAGGYSAELSFADPEQAFELARRLARPALAGD